MESAFATLDWVIFAVYAVVILGMGLFISKGKKGVQKTAQDYFLANKSLTWWAIGASLIAANISAEQFIGMSGSGYALGIGIACYEWIAAASLIIIAKYFIPIFIEKKIYTMPQFLAERYSRGVSTAFAIFWLLIYVFVNLTSVTYMGALAMRSILGVPLMYGIIGLALFSGIYSIYGGLKAVAWTDVVQVVFLVFGGLVTTYMALDAVGGDGGGPVQGFSTLFESVRDHFHMIATADEKPEVFSDLPGLGIILGGIWLTNFGYWGFNQYIIQKGLAAKSINDAKRGLLFGGYLKILIPLIVVIPGIAAFYLKSDLPKADEAYPFLLANYMPVGVRGLAFAALTAAIVSSLASMINSTSTIFTVDIYKPYFNPNATDKQQVLVGRIVAFAALFIAVLIAPMLNDLGQAFQYIQEYTGFIYPGVVVVFFMGLFWRQATNKAALWTALMTLPLGFGFKFGFPEMPWMMRMAFVFIILALIATVITFVDRKVWTTDTKHIVRPAYIRAGYLMLIVGVISAIIGVVGINIHYWANYGIGNIFMLAAAFIFVGIILVSNEKIIAADKMAIELNPESFKTGKVFNIGAVGILVILGLLYGIFW
ncbi:sodium:solute symporter family transporter [Geofilum sp. OHC36d9]|uniref:sodium:solute symporter family transporter n=1 Tax=Geofilum sp. OHC36d9 TaxID=3458413 RepID=UPI0040336919